MFGNLRIKTKIFVVLSSVAILAAGINGYIGFSTAKRSLKKELFNKLTAVREMKAKQVEDYFQQITNQILTFSEDMMIVDAMKAFKDGFEKVSQELGATDIVMQDIDTRLERYYQDEYLTRLNPNLDRETSVSEYWPQSDNTRILQDLYIASNHHATGAKHQLHDARDGSRYSQAHKTYHPIIKRYLDKFGYYDIFLVDYESGHIVYSVYKEVDYGTSLLTGPYQSTNFAKAFRQVRSTSDQNFVKLVDFEPYDPSYHAPASFIASPIYDGDEKIGVLVFQMPVDRINNVMTSNQAWAKVGLGKTGETYIVGDDYMIRNQSRFLIEDSENYFDMIKRIGIAPSTIAQIKNLRSTIGLQKIKTKGTEAALRGETGMQSFPDYRGVPVLSSYKPLNILDVQWAIMSEIDEEEAFTNVLALRRNMLLAFVGLIIAIVGVSFLFSKTFDPLRAMTEAVSQIAKGTITAGARVESHSRDEVGVLARGFNLMTKHLAGLVKQVQQAGIQVTTSATHLDAAGKELESMMTEQVASTHEVMATAKEIAATAQELVRTMDEVNGLSQQTTTSAELGQADLARMATTMQHMEEASHTIADQLAVIQERASHIATVITTITKVADQTNLLSLNAAIEADKAGAYGSGFAVVAREIRHLADQTAVATLDIERIVQEMTTAVSAGVVGMHQFMQEVAQGVKDVRTVGTQLTQIINQVQDLTPRFDTVSAGMQAQSQGAQQISEAMEQLSQAARQTATSLHESTRAIEQLTEAAGGLHDGISRFNVKA